PTRIMFAANLSWKTLNEILTDLEERGLIEQRTIGGRRLFFITEGGKRVLKAFEILSTEFTGQDLIYMQRPRDLMKTKHTLQINT
ncbi:MAG: winged helix-turn-helix domain-containing protein, partial [Candidatus Bathyarchaeia archaeon]